MTKGPGMGEICERLEQSGFPLSEAHAVEVFARQGDWHTLDYYGKIASLEAWEIDEAHLPALRKNLPNAEIKNVDSIRYIQSPVNHRSADLVIIDNPQNTFGDNGEYCEHFDVVDPALDVLRSGGVIIFNVNIEPFDYENSPDWKLRREQFYGNVNTASMSLDWLSNFYQQRFKESGRSVKDTLRVARTDYLYYFAYRLS